MAAGEPLDCMWPVCEEKGGDCLGKGVGEFRCIRRADEVMQRIKPPAPKADKAETKKETRKKKTLYPRNEQGLC